MIIYKYIICIDISSYLRDEEYSADYVNFMFTDVK